MLGASGYAGGELVRLLDSHDGFDLVHLGAHTHAGGLLREVHPQLDRGDRPLGSNELVSDIEFAFLALPHGSSAMLGHHDRLGGANAPWNAVHLSSGCSQENLVATGGAGLIYCFAAN